MNAGQVRGVMLHVFDDTKKTTDTGMVSREDRELTWRFKWYFNSDRDVVTIRRSVNDTIEIPLKQMVMERESGIEMKKHNIDHRDGNKLNNQRSNLKSCRNSDDIEIPIAVGATGPGKRLDLNRDVHFPVFNWEGKEPDCGIVASADDKLVMRSGMFIWYLDPNGEVVTKCRPRRPDCFWERAVDGDGDIILVPLKQMIIERESGIDMMNYHIDHRDGNKLNNHRYNLNQHKISMDQYNRVRAAREAKVTKKSSLNPSSSPGNRLYSAIDEMNPNDMKLWKGLAKKTTKQFDELKVEGFDLKTLSKYLTYLARGSRGEGGKPIFPRAVNSKVGAILSRSSDSPNGMDDPDRTITNIVRYVQDHVYHVKTFKNVKHPRLCLLALDELQFLLGEIREKLLGSYYNIHTTGEKKTERRISPTEPTIIPTVTPTITPTVTPTITPTETKVILRVVNPNTPIPDPQPNDKKQDSQGEKLCRQIIHELCPGKPFAKVRHPQLINPETGAKLELDCYNDELKVAVEYNGQQHYEFTPYWHRTIDNFYAQQRRDQAKLVACRHHNITLIIVPYTCVNPVDIRLLICSELTRAGKLPLKS